MRTIATYLVALMVFVVAFWVLKLAVAVTLGGVIAGVVGTVGYVLVLGLGALVAFKLVANKVTGKAR